MAYRILYDDRESDIIKESDAHINNKDVYKTLPSAKKALCSLLQIKIRYLEDAVDRIIAKTEKDC